MRRRSAARPTPIAREDEDGDEQGKKAGKEAGELDEDSVGGLAEREFDLLPHGVITPVWFSVSSVLSSGIRLPVFRLWVEAVWPAPAGDEIGFVGFEGLGQLFDVLFGRRSGGGEEEMGGDPGEIERGERSEKMAAVDGAEPVGQDEVVEDAGPEGVRHAEAVVGA